MTVPAVHSLRWSDVPGATVAECACGAWRREATLETVALTGRSRDEALRLAWLDHERDSAAMPTPVPDAGIVGP